MEDQFNNSNDPLNMNGENVPKKESGVGPLVGIIILVFGGLYYWGGYLNEQAQNGINAALDTVRGDTIASPNDEPAKIEGDLDAFNADAFDAQIEADLEALESEL